MSTILFFQPILYIMLARRKLNHIQYHIFYQISQDMHTTNL